MDQYSLKRAHETQIGCNLIENGIYEFLDSVNAGKNISQATNSIRLLSILFLVKTVALLFLHAL